MLMMPEVDFVVARQELLSAVKTAMIASGAEERGKATPTCGAPIDMPTIASSLRTAKQTTSQTGAEAPS